MTRTLPAEIRTERLLLRCWRAEDALPFLRAVEPSLEHLRPWLPWAQAEPSDPAEVAGRLAGFAAAFAVGKDWTYGIFVPGEGQVLGGCGLHPRRGPRVLEIGYWIHAHHTRRGYATEAALALTRAAFDAPEIERVEIRCDARNAASSGVPRRLGFPLVETIRDDPEAPRRRATRWSSGSPAPSTSACPPVPRGRGHEGRAGPARRGAGVAWGLAGRPPSTSPRPMQSALLLLLLASPSAAQLSVASVSPPRHALGVSTATNVVVTFDAPVDAATLGPGTFAVFGRWSGPRTGSLAVSGSTATWRPDRPFFPGELVTVSLSAGVQAAGGAPLAGGSSWTFWTRSSPGTGAFALAGVQSVRLPGEGLIQSYGIHAGDLDRDGSPDFSIPNEVANDVRVMKNDGCGVFGTPEIHPVPPGSTPSANDAGDFDGDGYPDLAVANISGDTTSVLLSDGSGSYQPSVSYASGGAPRGVAALDLEADGDTDLAVALRGTNRVALHANTGAGAFGAPALIEAGVNGETSIVAADGNLDGLADLFVGGYDSQTLAVLTAQGGGAFAVTDTSPAGGRPWQLAAGDVDGDGDTDAATCNSNTSSASIVRGDGAGALGNPETYSAGAFPLAVDLGDAEGDGDLDLAVSNYGSGTWTFRLNDGTGTFGPATTFDATFAGSCLIFVDDDRDGDMDLIGIDEISDELFFFRQQSKAVPGIQAGACAARLRVNALAGNAGFGAVPPHPVSLAERAFLDVSTAPGAAFAIGVGLPLAPGAATAFGLLNLSPAFPLAAGVADGFGEGRIALDLSPALAIGSTAALQGFTLPGAFTNAERVVITP